MFPAFSNLCEQNENNEKNPHKNTHISRPQKIHPELDTLTAYLYSSAHADGTYVVDENNLINNVLTPFSVVQHSHIVNYCRSNNDQSSRYYSEIPPDLSVAYFMLNNYQAFNHKYYFEDLIVDENDQQPGLFFRKNNNPKK